ncbi:MAG: efflux transporter outer membrane subunit [Desulfuromonas sp.]
MKRYRMFSIVTTAGLALLLAGCLRVGPDYHPLPPEAPPHWQAPALAAAAPAMLQHWWHEFQDPRLDRLIALALQHNTDLRLAEARLRQARSQRLQQQAQRRPGLDGSAGYSRNWASSHNGGGSSSLYQASLDASWELDLFGGLRRAVEAADAAVGARQAELADVQVSLLAEVALNYLDLCASAEQHELLRQEIATRGTLLTLTGYREQSGQVTALETAQARQSLAQLQAQLPAIERQRHRAGNALATLLASPAAELEKLLADAASLPPNRPALAIGLPAEVLRRRPDIRQAERQLAQQSAQVGVAAAELYPRLSLPATLGLVAPRLSQLLRADRASASLSPQLRWSLLAGGRLRAQLAEQQILLEQQLLLYRGQVLNAIEETENALQTLSASDRQQQHLAAALTAARAVEQLRQQQYHAGLSDFETVLDSRQSRLSLQQQYLTSRQEQLRALVQLYKAAGGGWNPAAERTTDNHG